MATLAYEPTVRQTLTAALCNIEAAITLLDQDLTGPAREIKKINSTMRYLCTSRVNLQYLISLCPTET
jgi:hypothetical protein